VSVNSGVFGYARVSTGKQKHAATIEMQWARITQHCRQNKITLAGKFEDNGISSRQPFGLRPGSGELLREAQAGRVKVILVYALDRLGRDGDSVDTQATLRRLWKLGVTIITLEQGLAVENTPTGRLLADIQCVANGYHRDTLVARSKESSRRLAKESEQWMGGVVPFGFRKQGEDRAARLVLEDAEAEVVRTIYAKFDTGSSYTEIAAYLTALGVPGVWDGPRIWEIMRNPAYRGVIYWGKRKAVWDEEGVMHRQAVPRSEWVERACPRIVEPELWQRVNARMDVLARAAKAHPKRDYPLSGLVRCATCGGAYVGVTSTQRDGSEKSYYRCSTHYRVDCRLRGIKCANPSVRAAALEEPIWEFVGGFLARPADAVDQLKAQLAAESQQGRNRAADLKRLAQRRQELVEARKRVLTQFGAGLFSDDDVKAEVRRIDAETEALDRERDAMRNVVGMAERTTIQLDWAGRLLGELRGQLLEGKLDAEKKRKFMQALVAGITIAPDGSAKAVFRFDGDFNRFHDYARSRRVREVTEQRYGHACR
jgi:site-specific DNA recombinase